MSRASAIPRAKKSRATSVIRLDPRVEAVAQFKNDPLGYVAWAFPWGEKGSDLEHETGPEPWQRDFLVTLGEKCRDNAFDGHTPVPPIRMATASGHDIGKTALVCWIILWIMSTRAYSNITVSATTIPQLQNKTWSQLHKWLRLCLNGDWFSYSNARGNLSLRAKGKEEEWFAIALTCKEENAEAFQGQHQPNSSSVYIFDEASGIPDKIWEASEGGLLDGEPMFLVFGNPTKNTGAFAQCFGEMRHRWTTRQIDSRTVARANQTLMKQYVEDYGEDSDFVRVRVRGVFPRSGASQFIATDLVTAAQSLVLHPSVYSWNPKLIGVDVAREGDDFSAIVRRQGLFCAGVKKLRVDDTMELAAYVMREIQEYEPDAVFIDAIGIGAGVVDRLRQLGHQVIPVKASEKPNKPGYYNLRANMWGDMRDWLKSGASIPKDPDLAAQLIAQPYGFSATDLVQLVGKKEMKNMTLPSPDIADALSFTFAYPVTIEDAVAAFRRVVNDNPEWDAVPIVNRSWNPVERSKN